MLNVLVVLAVLAADSPKTFITAASGVRLRATAVANGAEVTRLPICAVVRELEPPGAKVNVGGQEGVWEHLETSEGKQGWMFSPGLRALEPATADATYAALAAERIGKKDMSFVERADLYNCLKRASIQSKDAELGGKLALSRFTVLRDALAAVGIESEKQPYKGFLAQHKDDVVYSEPAGEWFANAKAIWDAEEKYHATSSGEPLAWLAATTAHPGECEGYLGCYLAYSGMEEGEYLKRHTGGAHVGAALKQYAEYKLKNAYIDDLDGADIGGIIKQVDEQLTLIRTCADSPERKKAEKALTTIRAALKKKQKA
jgi:hypothetical protein